MYTAIRQLLLICPLFLYFSFSVMFQNLKFSSHFSEELRGLKSLNLIHLSTMGGCIVYTRIRVLSLMCPFISSFFFLSNYQTLTFFITLFSGHVGPRKLKLGTHVDNGCMYRFIQELVCCCLFSLYWSIFLSLQFSVTNVSFSSDSTIARLWSNPLKL